jgi:thymidine kinase
MFAGKTEELLRRLRRAEIAGESVVTFSPATDTRYGEGVICTHTHAATSGEHGATCAATIVDPEDTGSLTDAFELGATADVVGIDEANFFTTDIVSFVEDLADVGCRVIVSGTDQTFRGEPFEPMGDLMAIADKVTKLSAICVRCGCQATRNQRLIDGEPAPRSSPTILVGGDESYEARCRSCHKI